MKIIFLDIDGVMNSLIYSIPEWGTIGRGWLDYRKEFMNNVLAETDEEIRKQCMWGTHHVDNLRAIMEATDAEVVISSTWRIGCRNIQNWNRVFKAHGLPERVIGTTPSNHGARGGEIEEWMAMTMPKDQDLTGFVILDDDADMLQYQIDYHMVYTNFNDGLDTPDVAKAIKILNGATHD